MRVSLLTACSTLLGMALGIALNALTDLSWFALHRPTIALVAWSAVALLAVAWVVLYVRQLPPVEIRRPKPYEHVPHRVTIEGIQRRGLAGSVQIFVLSGDLKWYPVQTTVTGKRWRADDVHIGSPNAPSGRWYHLVAVAGAPAVPGATDALPPGARSPEVPVIRQ